MPEDPDTMANWQRLSPEVTTSGRLSAGDIDRLAALGVRHVINLALTESPGALADEAALLAAAGIGYSHIPVPFDAPQESQFAAFRAALEEAGRPLHVHCIMNWRVSAFFYRWHRDHCGMAEAEARALMARQWQPDAGERGEWQVWAAFIEGKGS